MRLVLNKNKMGMRHRCKLVLNKNKINKNKMWLRHRCHKDQKVSTYITLIIYARPLRKSQKFFLPKFDLATSLNRVFYADSNDVIEMGISHLECLYLVEESIERPFKFLPYVCSISTNWLHLLKWRFWT